MPRPFFLRKVGYSLFALLSPVDADALVSALSLEVVDCFVSEDFLELPGTAVEDFVRLSVV